MMVRNICIDILQHTLLTLSTCFIVLEAAVQAGIPSLLGSALDLACSSFNHVLAQDHKGWAAMSREGVLLVLGSDKLQVMPII